MLSLALTIDTVNSLKACTSAEEVVAAVEAIGWNTGKALVVDSTRLATLLNAPQSPLSTRDASAAQLRKDVERDTVSYYSLACY